MDDLNLSASAFKSYDATPGVIGVDLDRLWNPVSLANKDDLVQLHLDTESRKLVVAVGLKFQMACLDPTTIRSEPTLPELELPASVTVDRDTLRQGMKAADLIADHVGFRMYPEEEVTGSMPRATRIASTLGLTPTTVRRSPSRRRPRCSAWTT